MRRPSTIYKIATRAEWMRAQAEGVFTGSDVDRRDGFIHFSTRGQLGETARRHFAGARDLVVLSARGESFGARLKWEPSRGGDLFPHLYGPLPSADLCEEPDLILEAPESPSP